MVKIYNKLTNFMAMKYANLLRSAPEKKGVPPKVGANRSRKRGGAQSAVEIARDGGDRSKMGANRSRKWNALEIRSGLCRDGWSMLGSRDG
jgi:hypothetical protein